MYHRLARTDTYRWWKPLVELLVFLAFVFIGWFMVMPVVYLFVGPGTDGAPGLIKLGLTIAVAFPAVFFAARIVRGHWGTLISVEGHLRVQWLATCVLVAIATMVASALVSSAIATAGHTTLGPERSGWVGWHTFYPLAISILIVITLQATAEEFVFRGLLLQFFGAYVKNPWFAIVLSGVLFALAHALPFEGFIAIFSFGLVAGWLTVKTGGLEAAIALHVINNVSLFLLDAATGRADRWITQLNQGISWSESGVDIAFNVLYGLVVANLYSRRVFAIRERPVQPFSRVSV